MLIVSPSPTSLSPGYQHRCSPHPQTQYRTHPGLWRQLFRAAAANPWTSSFLSGSSHPASQRPASQPTSSRTIRPPMHSLSGAYQRPAANNQHRSKLLFIRFHQSRQTIGGADPERSPLVRAWRFRLGRMKESDPASILSPPPLSLLHQRGEGHRRTCWLPGGCLDMRNGGACCCC